MKSKRELSHECQIFLYNLTILRKTHNLTQKQMAQILGISISSWRKIERGAMPPRLSAEVVYRAADAFEIAVAALFGDMEHEDMNSSKQMLLLELLRGEQSLSDGKAVPVGDGLRILIDHQ